MMLRRKPATVRQHRPSDAELTTALREAVGPVLSRKIDFAAAIASLDFDASPEWIVALEQTGRSHHTIHIRLVFMEGAYWRSTWPAWCEDEPGCPRANFRVGGRYAATLKGAMELARAEGAS